MMKPHEFAQWLLDDLGCELYFKRKREELLGLWPRERYDALADADRDFIWSYVASHREEMRALVRAGLQPRLPDEPKADAAAPVPVPLPDCPYCQRPCVGPEHDAYRVLHGNDPLQQQRCADERQRDMAEAVRRKRIRWGYPPDAFTPWGPR